MWRAGVNVQVSDVGGDDDDDWDTDADFVNDVSEKEQRWGAKTVEGMDTVNTTILNKLRKGFFPPLQTSQEKGPDPF